MVVLDTDHLSLLQAHDSKAKAIFSTRLKAIDSGEIATTVISYEEQMRGWLAYKARARDASQEVAAYARLKKHIEDYRTIVVLDFNSDAGNEYQRLRSLRIRIGSMDLKIAAIAIAIDATLLTRNLVDFRKVPGLRAEDWTS